jgi:hypothetical protein
MNRWTALMVAILACIVLAMGCSKGGGNPVSNDLTANQVSTGGHTQTHLWGYYDVYVDIPTQTATAVPNRDIMFAANVTQFLNGSATNLQFNINGTPVGTGYVDVDIDVSIKHPFSGMPQYNGYDVRGIFIGNGSKNLSYNSKLRYAARGKTVGSDQQMFDYDADLVPTDPHAGKVGDPDGYTRWWNPVEFTTPGLFGYTKGMYASGGYTATATLNPYKYFADSLAAGGDLWPFLKTGAAATTRFSSGTTNTRNYYLRFPTPSPGISFAYAVVANWKSEAPADHPSHATEAVGLSVTVTPDVYYATSSDKGGKLKLDMSFLRTWGAIPSTIYIESSVLSTPYQMTSGSPEMIPVGGGSSWSTYHVEIPANNVTGNSSTMVNEFWVIPQYDGYTYANDFGVTNTCGTEKLAAFFRYDLFVNFVAYNKAPIVGTISGPTAPSLSDTADLYTVTASDPDGDPITYSWTLSKAGTPLTGYNGVPGDGAGHLTINYSTIPGLVNNDTLSLVVKVSDNKGAFTISTPLSITVHCPTQIYYTSFDSSEGESSNWTRTSGSYWHCHWFDGSIDDDEASCTTYGTPHFYAWRTNGIMVPACWSGSFTLIMNWSCSKWEGYYDRSGVQYSLDGSSWSTLTFYDHPYEYDGGWWAPGFGQRTDHATLNTLVSPGNKIYIRFDSWSLDGCCNSVYSGWNINDMTIQ